MHPCQNCGKLNTPETNFCRFCGTKFSHPIEARQDQFNYSAPRPYSWKTDEFQTQGEPRRTGPVQAEKRTEYIPAQSPQAGPLAYSPVQTFSSFRCPHCMTNYPPHMERKISTAGWITFSVLLVFFFPLFWIGLLIKEDVPVCSSCNSRLGELYR